MKVGVVGTGALALFYAHWLASLGHHVVVYSYHEDLATPVSCVFTCDLEVDGSVIRCPSKAQPPTLASSWCDPRDFDVLILISTVQRVQKIVRSELWSVLADADIVLLTSWHDTYSQLRDQIPSNILPAYPVAASEEWAGHLAAVGTAVLEYDWSHSLDARWVAMLGRLHELGFRLQPMSMRSRFRARFSTTSFSYAYIRTLSGHSSRATLPEFNLMKGLDQLRSLVSAEPDLSAGLDCLPLDLERLWMQRAGLGSIGWIVSVLMLAKHAKVDYFIDRLPVGF